MVSEGDEQPGVGDPGRQEFGDDPHGNHQSNMLADGAVGRTLKGSPEIAVVENVGVGLLNRYDAGNVEVAVAHQREAARVDDVERERPRLVDPVGVLIASEMVDWEAPIGDYLMQPCVATVIDASRQRPTVPDSSQAVRADYPWRDARRRRTHSKAPKALIPMMAAQVFGSGTGARS